MTATTKQTAFAQKLFARNAALSARHGAPVKAASFAEEMISFDWNPENGRDVSAYIALYTTAHADAGKTLRRY